MAFYQQILRWMKDPPPEFVFEVSEAGLAWAATSEPPRMGLEELGADAPRVSPVKLNFASPGALAQAVARVAPPPAKPRPRLAMMALPDYCARVNVLDFDAFPSAPQEQIALARFRVKRTVPFDIDSALVTCLAQPRKSAKGVDVVTVVIAREIAEQYLAPFRTAGFHCGVITLAGLAALALDDASTTEAARWMQVSRAGRVLTLSLVERGALRLYRALELERGDSGEMLSVLGPTLALVEDELGGRPERLRLCGVSASEGEELGRALGCEVTPVHSARGPVRPANAGLLGLLTAVEVGWVR